MRPCVIERLQVPIKTSAVKFEVLRLWRPVLFTISGFLFGQFDICQKFFPTVVQVSPNGFFGLLVVALNERLEDCGMRLNAAVAPVTNGIVHPLVAPCVCEHDIVEGEQLPVPCKLYEMPVKDET